MTLYHYTCEHGRDGILASGLMVNPNKFTHLSWFTDLEIPDRDALGLTMVLTSCDRMQYRFRLKKPHETNGEVVPYHKIRRYMPPEARDALELAPGALLMHWWVAELPVAVEIA